MFSVALLFVYAAPIDHNGHSRVYPPKRKTFLLLDSNHLLKKLLSDQKTCIGNTRKDDRGCDNEWEKRKEYKRSKIKSNGEDSLEPIT